MRTSNLEMSRVSSLAGVFDKSLIHSSSQKAGYLLAWTDQSVSTLGWKLCLSLNSVKRAGAVAAQKYYLKSLWVLKKAPYWLKTGITVPLLARLKIEAIRNPETATDCAKLSSWILGSLINVLVVSREVLNGRGVRIQVLESIHCRGEGAQREKSLEESVGGAVDGSFDVASGDVSFGKMSDSILDYLLVDWGGDHYFSRNVIER